MQDDIEFQVLVNDEGQYSLWPLTNEVPAGWRADGFRGGRQECMDHVDEVWTDMRPLSLQRQMAADG
ncbi:MAG: MbtH protein [Actinomycetota bacterium]|jgi:MbtH protein|uniref:MbtH family protein n=1 Tax=Amycolatopsis sp. NPDC049252 TaxID=3363933 RepID=UPI0028C545A2|nr:MbtH protein [Actinomycetota bacterium]